MIDPACVIQAKVLYLILSKQATKFDFNFDMALLSQYINVKLPHN